MKYLHRPLCALLLSAILASCGATNPPFAPSTMNEGKAAKTRKSKKRSKEAVKEEKQREAN